jgi:hypothetical protein
MVEFTNADPYVVELENNGRECGSCTACCTLLPVKEFPLIKPAGKPCPHVIEGMGCAIYFNKPRVCSGWACVWLFGKYAKECNLPRPDECHFVVDTKLDEVTLGDGKTVRKCVQVWCSKKKPQAWRNVKLFSYIDLYANNGIGTLIRYDESP